VNSLPTIPKRKKRLNSVVLLLVAFVIFLGLNWYTSRLTETRPTTAKGIFTKVLSNFFPRNPRVGIQVGHLDTNDHPDELESLRYNTGASVDGLDEVAVNLAIAQHLKHILEAKGVAVELLPATIPRRYSADLVLSIHVDASTDRQRRGYKSAHFMPQRNLAEPELKKAIDRAYLEASGLPNDEKNVTSGMLSYYAFNDSRFRHSVRWNTPGVIVELGYLSNARDLSYLENTQAPASALASGVMDFLQRRGQLPTP
jgi:hypothetical protein